MVLKYNRYYYRYYYQIHQRGNKNRRKSATVATSLGRAIDRGYGSTFTIYTSIPCQSSLRAGWVEPRAMSTSRSTLYVRNSNFFVAHRLLPRPSEARGPSASAQLRLEAFPSVARTEATSQAVERAIRTRRTSPCPSGPGSATVTRWARASSRRPPRRSARRRSSRRRRLFSGEGRRRQPRPSCWTSCRSSNSSPRPRRHRPPSTSNSPLHLQLVVESRLW